MSYLWLVTTLASIACDCAFLPFIFMHGMNNGVGQFGAMISWIREVDPTASAYELPIAQGLASVVTNMWEQGDQVMEHLRMLQSETPDLYSEGYTLICHSHGAILCRTVVQRMDDHKVHTLIAMVGPQAGVYGRSENVASQFPSWSMSETSGHFYTADMQSYASVANYWHDPRSEWQSRYLADNTFLPVLNNNPRRTSQGPGLPKNDSEGFRYKLNLLRLRSAVFTSSSPDEFITPEDSGIFNFFAEDSNQSINLEDSNMWREDWIGLRALSNCGRLLRMRVQGVCHNCWYRSREVFQSHILPHLPNRTEDTPSAIETCTTTANDENLASESFGYIHIKSLDILIVVFSYVLLSLDRE